MSKVINHGATGYQQKCRCEICKRAHSIRAQVHNRAKMVAAQWVRQYKPEVYERILEDAYAYFNEDKRPVGRPANPDSWMADYNK